MVGLASDNRVDRDAEIFHARMVEYRKRLRSAVADAGSLTLEQEDRLAYELERDLDDLLMRCANLAREPMLRHMAKAMEAAAVLAPMPLRVYPDPKKGAES